MLDLLGEPRLISGCGTSQADGCERPSIPCTVHHLYHCYLSVYSTYIPITVQAGGYTHTHTHTQGYPHTQTHALTKVEYTQAHTYTPRTVSHLEEAGTLFPCLSLPYQYPTLPAVKLQPKGECVPIPHISQVPTW